MFCLWLLLLAAVFFSVLFCAKGNHKIEMPKIETRRLSEFTIPLSCCVDQKPKGQRFFNFFEEIETRRITSDVIVLQENETLESFQFWSPLSYEVSDVIADKKLDEVEVPGLKLTSSSKVPTPLVRVNLLINTGSKWKSILRQPITIADDCQPLILHDFDCFVDSSLARGVMVLQREYLTDAKCPNMVRIGTTIRH